MNSSETALLALLALYLNPGTAQSSFYAGKLQGVSVPSLITLCEMHKVTPMIYSAAKRVPGFFSDERNFRIIKSAALATAASQMRRSSVFLSVYKKLREASIDALAVKGIVLRSIYPEPDLRISADEDILIPPGQLEETRRVLSDSGFSEIDVSAEEFVHTFVSSDGLLHIEVHPRLFPPYPKYADRLNSFFPDPFSNPECHIIDGVEVYSLNCTSHLLFLILHSLKHFIYCGFGIRQVADFAVYARTYKEKIDTDAVALALKSISADRFLSALLGVCEEYLGFSANEMGFDPALAIKGDIDDFLSDIMSAGAYGNNSEERIHSSAVTMASADGKRGGLLSSLFPPYELMRYKYPFIDGKKLLLPAAWTARAFNFVFRKGSHGFDTSESLEISRQRLSLLKKYGIV